MSYRLALIAICSVLAAVAWPAVSLAAPTTSGTVSAQVTEQLDGDRWTIVISWTAECDGVDEGKSPVYDGELYLLDLDTGERTSVGPVVDASGQETVSGTRTTTRSALRRAQHLQPEFVVYCYEEFPQEAGNEIATTGDPVTIPPAFGRPGGGGGGGGGGGSGSGGGGDATEPIRAGGCIKALIGTNSPETLTGSGEGDVIIGFNGGDRLEGLQDHDCLVGGRGDDILLGADGFDRLTGGSGADLIEGGAGVNSYKAGSGRDHVKARNGKRETVRCGSGLDRAKVDRKDRVRSCERLNPRS